MLKSTAFATVLHDPDALLAEPLMAAAPGLAETFSGLAVSLTEATHPRIEELMRDRLGARVGRHPTGEAFIGQGRRHGVALALDSGTDRVIYADPDHMLRWLTAYPDELQSVLATQPEVGFLIVGRSARAFADVPRRLQETEAPINQAYELITGRQADLLSAVRRMDRAAARDIVANSSVDSFGNDVEWPLLAERLGHHVGYVEADGLTYRTIEQYGATADSYDAEPLQWIRRIEMAAVQATAMRPYLRSAD
ncbi:hypothetical protein VW23_018595 [Devosia insulae DS-56]|uniref:Glycosyltransferase 2-like domain-containing protein n=1 Tax=Devosia insulae DS-56 TaxID=1116389 RepID=A0A1E5XQU8_9HYPH|nr:hypothetical protein [Devosia insulae]OEO30976.1 hypothetical protein VW23_018595 [Devosia insulae DS-56]